MKEEFKAKEFRSESMGLIEQVNEILDEYQAQGYTLTLRQVYYQLVARGFVPNTIESYTKVGGIVSTGRLAGFIDWDLIEDRARETITPAHWDSVSDILESCARQFRVDPWEEQPCHVEVLVEKQALEGVLLPVTKAYSVPFTACKGYLSQSMMYRVAKRLEDHYQNAGQKIVLLYLGDHDPSGLDMDRDLEDRIGMFTRGEVEFDLERLALTWGQISKYAPPENPAKVSDSRATAYIQRHGHSSWELDALEPKVLVKLVEDAITARLDLPSWQKAKAKETEGRRMLKLFADQVRGQEEA